MAPHLHLLLRHCLIAPRQPMDMAQGDTSRKKWILFLFIFFITFFFFKVFFFFPSVILFSIILFMLFFFFFCVRCSIKKFHHQSLPLAMSSDFAALALFLISVMRVLQPSLFLARSYQDLISSIVIYYRIILRKLLVIIISL